MHLSITKKNSLALLPTIAQSGPMAELGTGFLICSQTRVFVVASEHNSPQGKSYYCVAPDSRMTASHARAREKWITLQPIQHFPERHQLLLSFGSNTDLGNVLSTRESIQRDRILHASDAMLGDNVEVVAFWATNPDVPGALR